MIDKINEIAKELDMTGEEYIKTIYCKIKDKCPEFVMEYSDFEKSAVNAIIRLIGHNDFHGSSLTATEINDTIVSIFLIFCQVTGPTISRPVNLMF